MSNDILIASRTGDLESVLKFIKSDPKCVDFRDNEGNLFKTPLMHASCMHHSSIVSALVRAKCDVNARDKRGYSALMHASGASKERRDIVSYLIAHGAEVNLRGNDGETALIKASFRGHLKIVRCLAEHGADPNLATSFGETALMLGAYTNHFDVVRFLADSVWEDEMKCDVKAVNNKGWNAISYVGRKSHRAEIHESADIIRFLHKRGVDANPVHSNGDSTFASFAKAGRCFSAGVIASLVVKDPYVRYDDIAFSHLIPKAFDVPEEEFRMTIRNIIPLYLERVVSDPAFATAMQQDIEKILRGEKTEKTRSTRASERMTLGRAERHLIEQTLRVIRAIDYTDGKKPDTDESYDMEL